VFYWKEAPTATEFTVGGGTEINQTGHDYIAYLFASAPGICDIGTYTGTSYEQEIDCGFTNGARFVLIKRTDDTGNWMHFDTLRGITDSTSPMLFLNNSRAQIINSEPQIKPSNRGFRLTNDASVNEKDGEYIYMAIA
jgi:hypothetical protein